MTRKDDESLAAIQEMQHAGTAVYKVEDMEVGRRLAVEKELELPGPTTLPALWRLEQRHSFFVPKLPRVT
jgi:peptidylprolyl isomerase domain and WD repeat-containing protein 1